jgi:hypothetical protein
MRHFTYHITYCLETRSAQEERRDARVMLETRHPRID